MMAYRMLCAVVGLATTITAAAVSTKSTTSVETAQTPQYCCTVNCWYCVALTCNPKDPKCGFPWPVCCATELRGVRADGSKIAYNKAGKEIIWVDAEAYPESQTNATDN